MIRSKVSFHFSHTSACMYACPSVCFCIYIYIYIYCTHQHKHILGYANKIHMYIYTWIHFFYMSNTIFGHQNLEIYWPYMFHIPFCIKALYFLWVIHYWRFSFSGMKIHQLHQGFWLLCLLICFWHHKTDHLHF